MMYDDYFDLDTGLRVLPTEIQHSWRADLIKAEPTEKGVWRLVDIWPTKPGSGQEQRLIVQTIDESGYPIANIKVAFSFSTADYYPITNEYLWSPPHPRRAFVVNTKGSGTIEHIQNDPVKDRQPGGVTCYLLTPEFSSDIVTGLGMLANHTGLHLVYQLRRPGHLPLRSYVSLLEKRIEKLEKEING